MRSAVAAVEPAEIRTPLANRVFMMMFMGLLFGFALAGAMILDLLNWLDR
jgi:hypothetical protein